MSDEIVRLLVFRVGTLACAADAAIVREILPRLVLTRIPGAPPVISGLANVRGSLVTVVAGWRALKQPRPETDQPDGTTILLELAGRRVVGLAVDEVIDLLSVAGATLEPGLALAGIDATLVRAVGRRAGQLFVVLDTDALLAPMFTS
ncbi:MAG TPA: chemotaxis protein CheW [Gemmatimonadales bacterium]|nr:chemotaxis protein CheW [Gemmatimonadales bacterium]